MQPCQDREVADFPDCVTGTPPAVLAHMTQPRCILPGTTYLITRRTLRRYHLLRPDSATTNAILYVLAACARRYHILVHAFCVQSTHYHLVATDTLGQLPLFLAQFNRIVSLIIKAIRRWEGSVWDHEQSSAVRLETLAAVIDKIAYCAANPVAARLVRSASHWPGNNVWIGRREASLTAHRPPFFLDENNRSWQAELRLQLDLPPGVGECDRAAFVESVAQAIDGYERAARDTSASRHKVLGARRVLMASPFRRTTSRESLRKTNPTFAVGAIRGAYIEATRALRAFRSAYRAALTSWQRGLRDTCFPCGTWLMKQCHGAHVAPS